MRALAEGAGVDFGVDEGQAAVTELAATVLGREAAPAAWRALADAGLLGLAVPEDLGGAGLGVLETALLLTEIGRQAAELPALGTLALGVLPLVALGSRAQQEQVLPAVLAGDQHLTAAINEPGDPLPARPATTAVRTGDTLTITGRKTAVRQAATAHSILVSVTLHTDGPTPPPANSAASQPPGDSAVAAPTGGAAITQPTGNSAGLLPTNGAEATQRAGRPAVVLLDPTTPGVTREPSHTSSTQPESTLVLNAVTVPAAALLTGADHPVKVLHDLAVAGAVALADGLLAGVLDLTTTHLKTRHQFGRPLAAFQAVAQQIADVYVAARTVHLLARSAAWRLATGRDATEDLAVAAYWLAEELPNAMHLCHHLHGGLGVDASYPLPRYSAQARDLARLVGGVDDRLDVLGQLSTHENAPENGSENTSESRHETASGPAREPAGTASAAAERA